jgi:DNA repair protein RadA/Sms
MPRLKTAFFCSECGGETARWQGQCPSCQAWNSLAEAPQPAARSRRGAAAAAAPRLAVAAQPLAAVAGDDTRRWRTDLAEFDFVLGGGIVPGSVVLVGGEPGIGKSTLLLQVAARLQAAGHGALYVSGEESAAQVRLRADRLGEDAGQVAFLAETDLDAMLASTAERQLSCLFVDSIQTVYAADVEGTPGNVTQVRECAARLQRFAKESGVAVFLVGHVTKGGVVAGPRTLEHIVDTVLYFEGAGALDHRVLRAPKNRFGAADEIGVFRMTGAGLVPVANPSAIFLSDRRAGVSGAAVVATIEGTRPLLVEVQALCARAAYGAPQRVATGFDRQRLALLIAILEKRVGLAFSEVDVFVNLVGGVRIQETAADLAVAMALASSLYDRPLPEDAVFIGELGLGGELRGVSQVERRLTEAARMGFGRAFVAERSVPARSVDGLRPLGRSALRDLMRELFT